MTKAILMNRFCCLGKIRTLTGGTRIRRATITPQGNLLFARQSYALISKSPNFLHILNLEGYVHGEADAAEGVGGAAVCESPYVFDAEEAEDVVEANGRFHVGGVVEGVDAHALGELRQVVVVFRVVAAAKVAPKGVEAEYFAQFEALNPGNVVEEGAVGVVYEEEGGVCVGDKLHRVHERKALRAAHVGEVGIGHAQFGEWRGGPDVRALGHNFEVAPRRKPEALLEADFGGADGEGVAEDAAGGYLVGYGENRGVEAHRLAVTLCLVIPFAGGVAQLHAQARFAVMSIRAARSRDERDVARAILNLVFNLGVEREVVFEFEYVFELVHPVVGLRVAVGSAKR